jgi:hypothetical protein
MDTFGIALLPQASGDPPEFSIVPDWKNDETRGFPARFDDYLDGLHLRIVIFTDF